MKQADSVTEKQMFDLFIMQVKAKGYKYLEKEMMGRILVFEKDGKRETFDYPRVIKIKWER